MKNKAVIYIHGKGGSAAESEHYKPLFPDRDVIGFDYLAQTPWEAKEEFAAYFRKLSRSYESISVIANSIGAFFAMNAPIGGLLEKAYFISPVVHMEQLIVSMMAQTGVTENMLKEKGTIETPFGETLSWSYLCYVRENPIQWEVPTHILYGEKDGLTPFETMAAFAGRHGAALTVMAGGGHWFHTEKQMAYADRWLRNAAGLTARKEGHSFSEEKKMDIEKQM